MSCWSDFSPTTFQGYDANRNTLWGQRWQLAQQSASFVKEHGLFLNATELSTTTCPTEDDDLFTNANSINNCTTRTLQPAAGPLRVNYCLAEHPIRKCHVGAVPGLLLNPRESQTGSSRNPRRRYRLLYSKTRQFHHRVLHQDTTQSVRSQSFFGSSPRKRRSTEPMIDDTQKS